MKNFILVLFLACLAFVALSEDADAGLPDNLLSQRSLGPISYTKTYCGTADSTPQNAAALVNLTAQEAYSARAYSLVYADGTSTDILCSKLGALSTCTSGGLTDMPLFEQGQNNALFVLPSQATTPLSFYVSSSGSVRYCFTIGG